jgi:hypothetical protein
MSNETKKLMNTLNDLTNIMNKLASGMNDLKIEIQRLSPLVTSPYVFANVYCSDTNQGLWNCFSENGTTGKVD